LNTPKKKKTSTKKFNIKNDPHVVVRGIIYSLTSVVLIACICISAYNIIRWKAENDISDQQIVELQAETTITEVDPEPTPETKEKGPVIANIPSTDPYWELSKLPLIDVDLSSSLAKNQDVAGWIQVPGTNINYPFVHTDNNDYYLKHSLNRTWSSAGWVFLDASNNINLTDQNQIIYAHGRLDGSMFGSLTTVLTGDWQNDTKSHVVKISTLKENSLWQVFSVYRIPVTSDYLTTSFESDSDFDNFLQMISARSAYDFKTTAHSTDKIITLSTCIGTTERAVLHAKLIKIAQK
jgi:sortase B